MKYAEDKRYRIDDILSNNVPDQDQGLVGRLVGRDANAIQYKPNPNRTDNPYFVAREGEIHRCCFRIIATGGTNPCNACEDSAKKLILQVTEQNRVEKRNIKLLVSAVAIGMLAFLASRVMSVVSENLRF